MSDRGPKFKKILLKLSGEALAGNNGYGIDPEIISGIAGEIREVIDLGVQVAPGYWRRQYFSWAGGIVCRYGSCQR